MTSMLLRVTSFWHGLGLVGFPPDCHLPFLAGVLLWHSVVYSEASLPHLKQAVEHDSAARAFGGSPFFSGGDHFHVLAEQYGL